ncbi:MAG: amidohydrolase family protein [Actinobacteria bacterium]|nr:amidohydrolase family protein [Actinomycetota bacterium]
MSILDSHHHLWDPALRRYAWMDSSDCEPLRRRFDLAGLKSAITATPVKRTILVQATAAIEETRELLELAGSSEGLVAGVVGWIDLTGDVEGQLEELRAGPGGGLLVGVRHQAEDELDPRWLVRPDVLRGLEAVAERGLVFDLLVRPPQLPAAVAVTAAMPGLQFVLDHGGKPPIASGATAAWRRQVEQLAAGTNVFAKLSGLVTEADAGRIRAVLPYARELLEIFGPRRLMFGSDWPVCTLVASYRQTLDLALESLEGLASEDLEAVLCGTASRVYLPT